MNWDIIWGLTWGIFIGVILSIIVDRLIIKHKEMDEKEVEIKVQKAISEVKKTFYERR